MQQETFQETNSATFTAVTDDGQTCISRDQEFTLRDAVERTYSQVAADFLTITGYADRHGLRLKGDSTKALAFFLMTRGIGNLWFESAE